MDSFWIEDNGIVTHFLFLFNNCPIYLNRKSESTSGTMYGLSEIYSFIFELDS